MVAETNGSLKITVIQNVLYLIGLEVLWDIGLRPASHSGDTRREIDSDIPANMQKTQE
jgi:hypothetical protein